MSTRYVVATIALLSIAAAPAPARVRVGGSTTVNPVVVDAAALVREDLGIEFEIDTFGGSSGGLSSLAEGRIEIAMSSRPVSGEDRRRFPEVDFHSTPIGFDTLALVVSRDVWEGGIQSLDRQSIRQLYEGRVRNWRQLGGPDRRVVFFDKEPGRGTWEVFARWLYGNLEAVPLVSLPQVGSNEEARSKVAATPGAITQLSAAWADSVGTFALSLVLDDGRAVAPTADNGRSGHYPLLRPLLLVTDGAPSGESKRLIDFLRQPRGQHLLPAHGYLGLPASQGTAASGGSR